MPTPTPTALVSSGATRRAWQRAPHRTTSASSAWTPPARLEYAHEAGLVHDVVHADLESGEPSDEQRALLATADLVVSTGCVGYVTEKTLTRVATAHPRRRPWMAHFVLRMFDFAPIAAELAALGYRTEQAPGLYEQRRFASEAERAQVLNTLSANGIDTTGREDRGWLYATLYVSRPLPKHHADTEDPH